MTNFNEFEYNIVVKNSDYIVRDHRVHQVRIMPGVTFLDVIFRILQAEQFDMGKVELRNILFKEAIATTEFFDKNIKITLKNSGDYGIITVKSSKVKNGQSVSSEWDANFECELHITEEMKKEKIYIEDLKKRANKTLKMDEAYSYTRKAKIFHGEFMKSMGDIYVGDDYLLAELHVGELASKFIKEFKLHPAYLDASTIVPYLINSSNIPDESMLKPFIPMYIETFRANKALEDKCYVYVKREKTKISDSRDVTYADIEIFNHEGESAVYLTKLAAKQIRAKELIESLKNVGNSDKKKKKHIKETSQKEITYSNSSVQRFLQEIIGNIQGKNFKKVSIKDGFYEQGLDSTQLLQVVREIEQKIGQQLYPTLLFEYTNISDLSKYLEQEYGEMFKGEIVQEQTCRGKEDSTNSVQRFLREIIGNIQGKNFKEVSIEDGFYEQGLDSTQLLQVVREVEQRIGQQLYPTLLFEYTNISDLSKYLKEEYGESFEGKTEERQIHQSDNDSKSLYFVNRWVEKMCHSDNSTDLLSGCTLVLDTDNTLFNDLKDKTGENTKDESHIILVKPAKGYSVMEEEMYGINPTKYEDYEKLLKELKNKEMFPDKIIHNWSKESFGKNNEDLKEQLNKSIYSLFHLSKALMKDSLKSKIKLMYIYSNLEDEIQPHYAAITGFCRVVSMENPKLVYKTIEIKNSITDSNQNQNIADRIIDEFRVKNDKEIDIRYKGENRFVKQFSIIDREKIKLNNLRIKDKGTYIITGGMGGLGIVFAKHLAEKVKSKLVLVGRSDLDTNKKEKIKELESLGAQVVYVKANISNKDETKKIIDIAKDSFNSINGIIHIAGIISDSFVIKKDMKEVDLVLASKVYGTKYIDEASKDENLDFFAMFSSTSAVIGNIGQADYSYANSFMDNYAISRERLGKINKRKGKTISINWSLWENGGMQVNEQSKSIMKETAGIIPLSNEKGIAVFEETLKLPYPQIIVVEGDEDRIKNAVLENQSATNIRYDKKKYKEVVKGETKTTEVDLDDIAIIGISGAYPKARNLREFWENLKNGRDCITEIPKDRWDHNEYYDPEQRELGKAHSKWGGFIDDIDKFDSLIFNISPKEAQFMDPQERKFLETTWETFEDAGYSKNTINEKNIGVYVGVMWGQYQMFAPEMIGEPTLPSSIYASVANRVSYFFDLKGPSITMDTMCSSALAAIHMAYESIRRGECEMALAGGVNLTVHPYKYLLLSQNNFTSSDGRCRSFGEGGDGYVPGEGVGAVLLKPLKKAKRDGNHIYAVVKGSALNHGGKTSGYTVPNPMAQAKVIEDALKKANVDARSISYIEAHGTGTSLGDPIEMNGLSKAFNNYTRDKQFCSIGSVKSNIGHLESAAGIASITKVVLQMKHKKLVPSIHCDTLNSNINFENSHFYVQKSLQDWEQPIIETNSIKKKYPRRAGVSSFGAGGTNAHIILEEYDEITNREYEKQREQIIILSAKDRKRLKEYVEKIINFVKSDVSISLSDFAYTLQVGREDMDERLGVVVSDFNELIDKLSQFIEGNKDNEDLYINNINSNSYEETLKLFSGESGQEIMELLIKSREFKKLASLWVKGIKINWQSLHYEYRPRRISIPTYPFEKRSHWLLTKAINKKSFTKQGQVANIHPLISKNESNFEEVKFTYELNEGEIYVGRLGASNEKVFLGTTYLEMARVASEITLKKKVKTIRDIEWSKPIILDTIGKTVDIHLYKNQDIVEYEISTENQGVRTIHSQGRLEFTNEFLHEVIDIQEIEGRCDDKGAGIEVYNRYKNKRLENDRYLENITEIICNENEVLSKLTLPRIVEDYKDEFKLEPLMLELAIQPSMSLSNRKNLISDSIPMIYSIGQIDIINSITCECYVYTTLSSDKGQNDIDKFDIKITDSDGNLLVRMTDVSIKLVSNNGRSIFGFNDEEMLHLLQKLESGELNSNNIKQTMGVR